VRGPLVAIALSLGIVCAARVPPAHAEHRLYVLRVTPTGGEPYETLSSLDPYTYASNIGAAVRISRDYRRVTSREADIRVMATWIERREPLRKHWKTILQERGFYDSQNHRRVRRAR